MKKLGQACVSILLCLCLVSQVLPFRAVAQKPLQENIPVAKETSQPEILGEIAEKRTANSKTFRMSDGTLLAAVYPETVHYEEDGEWKEIDNRLVEMPAEQPAGDEKAENTVDNGGETGVLANAFSMKFAQFANKKKLVRLKQDEYQLSWGFTGADKVRQQTVALNIQQPQDERQAATLVDHLTSKIIYPGVFEQTDLSYTVTGSAIKEELILAALPEDTRYTMALQTKNLAARMEQDRSVEFYDPEEPDAVIWRFAPPMMYDSAGASSENIEVALTETDQGYSLELIPDRAWLAAADRVYPVIVDPTVTTDASGTKNQGAFISSTKPTTALGAQNALPIRVGRNDADGYGVSRAFMKIDLPDLGIGSQVVGAVLALTTKEQTPDPSQIVTVRKLNSDWNPKTVTWNTQPQIDGPVYVRRRDEDGVEVQRDLGGRRTFAGPEGMASGGENGQRQLGDA